MPTRRPSFRNGPHAVALAAILGAIVGTSLAPAPAHAQFATVEARAGVARATGSYADALGTGQTIGVGLGMRFTPTLGFRIDADANTGFEGGAASPDLYTYMLGLETELAPARGLRPAPLRLTASLSGGASQFRYRGYADPLNSTLRYAGENEWRPAVAAGVRLTAELTRTLGIFGGAAANATLLGGRERDGTTVRPDRLDDDGVLVTIPLVAGLRIRF
jgi:hypothetical protein